MINIIAAIGLNCELGHSNQLLCLLPNDLKYFKEKTQGQFCVFGRKTYESIGHPLPNRFNIILTRNTKYQEPVGTYVYSNLDDVIREYKSYNDNANELFICGGAEVYRQALPYANRIYLTIIDHKFPQADTYFPAFSLDEWKPVKNVKNNADENNLYEHYFVTYERKNNTK